MAKNVNASQLSFAVSRQKSFQKKLRDIAEIKLQKSKNILINEFQSHPVSKEISSGPDANNISGTLGGYGNLFSFIGFSTGSAPINQWVQLLKSKIQIVNSASPRASVSGNTITYSFKVYGITKEDLDSARMPWEGRSWITSIERGISGFSFYLSKKMGRSGGGIQSNNKIRSGKYTPVPYWSDMWLRFIKNLTS